MGKIIAFLRAINVGGHTTKMEELRGIFGELGFSKVETFIASGNVIFDEPVEEQDGLAERIEKHLSEALGYEVSVFLRSPAQVAEIARLRPFDETRMQTAGAFNVAFLKAPLTAEGLAALKQYETGIDEFAASGCEMYWLCRVKQSESKFSNAIFERALKIKSTLRGINSIRRLADLYPPASNQ